ncbi:MAG: GIY-YIG nuclease family protein [Fibrobacter sp.]|nr:GIY-YIG nuclease family protein [Fibrobacter sp.]
MNTIQLEDAAWNKLIAEAEKNLVGSLASRIKIESDIIGNPEKTIPSEVPKQSGIYAIWVGNVAKYVGEAKNLRARLRAHLIYRSDKTGSKLENVMNVYKDNDIFVSFMHVEPESIRLAVEDKLIGRLRDSKTAAHDLEWKYDLEWNKQSAGDTEISDWILNHLSEYKIGATTYELLYYAFMDKFGVVNDDESMVALNNVLENLAADGKVDIRTDAEGVWDAVSLK